MVDVVEVVARAICRNDGYDPDQHWEEFVRAARAAIAAYEAAKRPAALDQLALLDAPLISLETEMARIAALEEALKAAGAAFDKIQQIYDDPFSRMGDSDPAHDMVLAARSGSVDAHAVLRGENETPLLKADCRA